MHAHLQVTAPFSHGMWAVVLNPTSRFAMPTTATSMMAAFLLAGGATAFSVAGPLGVARGGQGGLEAASHSRPIRCVFRHQTRGAKDAHCGASVETPTHRAADHAVQPPVHTQTPTARSMPCILSTIEGQAGSTNIIHVLLSPPILLSCRAPTGPAPSPAPASPCASQATPASKRLPTRLASSRLGPT